MQKSLNGLFDAQRALRSRFDDFRRALDRRDAPAYRFGLGDFYEHLASWSAAQEAALLPAVVRVGVPGRDPRRELHLEWVQLRELTRFLITLVADPAKLSDALGITDNLDRRLAAHENELLSVYYRVAEPELTEGEWKILSAAAPG
ncbi:MAG: hypothetical protein ACRD16_17700 [Thermoanaerobaculia bacterium]